MQQYNSMIHHIELDANPTFTLRNLDGQKRKGTTMNLIAPPLATE